jgi:hypothetical protein
MVVDEMAVDQITRQVRSQITYGLPNFLRPWLTNVRNKLVFVLGKPLQTSFYVYGQEPILEGNTW